MVGRYYWQ